MGNCLALTLTLFSFCPTFKCLSCLERINKCARSCAQKWLDVERKWFLHPCVFSFGCVICSDQMIRSALELASSPRRPFIEKSNLPRCTHLKSVAVESDEDEEIIILPNQITNSLLTSLSTELLWKATKSGQKLEDEIAVQENCVTSTCATHPLEEYRHFYGKITARRRIDKQREVVVRRYEQGWSLLPDHFTSCQQASCKAATTKQASQKVLIHKRNHLESVLIDLKHDLAADFTRSKVPYPLPGVIGYSCQCITIEFFGSIIAPLTPGVFSVNFQAYFCGVHTDRKVVEFVDLATSFVCVVNQKGCRSHVYEYWLPDVSTLSCQELYLVLEGEQVERIVQTSKLGNLADLSRGSGKLVEKKIVEKKEEVNGKAKNGLGRKRKCKEPAVDNPIKKSSLTAMVNTTLTSKRVRLSSASNRATPSKPSNTPSRTPLIEEPGNQRGRGRRKRNADPILDQGSTSCPPNMGQKRLYGVKLIGKWIRNGARKTVQGFIPNYGTTGVDLINETEDGQISSRKRKQQTSTPTFETMEQIQQLTRTISTSSTTYSTLQMEISNENGYGNPESQRKKSKKRQIKSTLTYPPQPAISYQFLPPWVTPTCKMVASASGDCSPASDCSFSDTSSGYASMSTDSSKSSLKYLDELASSMATLPNSPKTHLAMKCVICDTVFDTLQRLMLHLHTSYPSFCFEYGRSKENIIDVCLAGKTKQEMVAEHVRVNRRKCVRDKTKIQENIFLNKKCIEDWRRKLLLKKLPSVPNAASITGSAKCSAECSSSMKSCSSIDFAHVIKKPNYKDLFLENLPFVGPTYTKLNDPPLPNLFGVDTNQGWLKDLSQWRLHQFTDVTDNEKHFFVIWNSFVIQRPNRAIGCRRLSTLLRNFVELKGQEVVERNLLFNFLSHCAVLQKQGFISQDEMFAAILLLQRLDIPKEKFYISPVHQQQLRRSPRKVKSCNKILKETG